MGHITNDPEKVVPAVQTWLTRIIDDATETARSKGEQEASDALHAEVSRLDESGAKNALLVLLLNLTFGEGTWIPTGTTSNALRQVDHEARWEDEGGAMTKD